MQNIFFLTFPVGLESIGEDELHLKWPLHFKDSNFIIQNRVMGGIEIECSLAEGFLLNLILKCPSRILLRLSSFKCRDVPKLFQRTSKFNWSSYLLSTNPKVHISATESRLFDSRKIEKAFHDGVAEFFRHQPMKKKYQDLGNSLVSSPEVFIRFENDTCTFSLDTTGELLHKRGEKLLGGHAPLRESLASLLLLILGNDIEKNLIDPMCGSGTFLIEAHDFFKINSARLFSFQNTPLIIDQKILIPKIHDIDNKLYANYLGSDIDPHIITETTKNLGNRNITLTVEDILRLENKNNDNNNIVIVNPPYGKRIGNKNEIDINYYLKIIIGIKNNFSPKKIGIIIPQEFTLRPSKEIILDKAIPFKNGGIPVVFYVLNC